MIQIEPAALIRKLNNYCTKALEGAAGVCVSRGHYEVKVEHLLAQLLLDPNADFQWVLKHFGLDLGRVAKALQRQLETERTGNTGRPVFSPMLLSWFSDAWLLGSTEHNWLAIRSGSLFTTLVLAPHSYTAGSYVDLFSEISKEELRHQLPKITDGSAEDVRETVSRQDGGGGEQAGPHSRGPDTALGRFTMDFTAQARAGEMDPVVGRETEIRQAIDILARRRKNNPIIVGEAGTGKTALVEGLAQKIVAEDVPENLIGVELLSLDMGLLQAGAGMKGEFENRLKSVIEEVKASDTPIIIFIDEAHTLIGAGGAAGGSDAANLLKPALARGELRTVAATTWSEYKKYFEKDPALARRFQLIKVDEPSVDIGVEMMRGIAPNFAKSHGVQIREDAVKASVELSARYITGRQLPDKSVDLIDTCAARVGIAQSAKPPALQDIEYEILLMNRHHDNMVREQKEGVTIDAEELVELEAKLAETEARRQTVEERWKAEQAVAKKVIELRREISSIVAAADEAEEAEVEAADEAAAEAAPEDAAPAVDGEEAEETQQFRTVEEIKPELDEALAELEKLQEDEALVPVEVTSDLVAAVIADWTGIPIGKMVEDEAAALLEFEDRIAERIKGQDFGLNQIGEVIRASKMGLGNPKAPIGVFLLVGPSGVGKTETGLAMADLLFGGERFMVTVNMSEFQEKHTVSRLIGSPPGYVGYGEGGVLTEAVRQRPYSAVMLDEVEKADPEVLNLFYQVFDKGSLNDGEGREIDFKNTILLMTSNLASDVMTKMCEVDPRPDSETIVSAVRPILSNHFKPALLARMTIVPFFPLDREAMRQIVELKLGHLKRRMMDTHRVTLEIGDKVVQQITDRCTTVETGARNIDQIMVKSLLPLLSKSLLAQMSKGPLPDTITLDADDQGEYTLTL